MKFAQIIEFRSSHGDQIKALEEEWMAASQGTRPHSIGISGVDRDRPDTFLVVVQWDSYEEAQKNNDLPQTNEYAQKMAALCDEPPTFRNIDVRTDWHDE